MLTQVLDILRDFFARHPRAKPVIITIGLISVATYIYTSFYIVYVPVETSHDSMTLDSLSVQAYSSNSATTGLREAKTVQPNFISILPRSFNYFEAKTDDYATIQSSQPSSWQPFAVVPLILSPQKDLQKISTSGGACPVIGESETVYTYRCGNPRFLYSHNTSSSPWSIDSDNLLSQYRIVKPYKNGILGVRSGGAQLLNRSFTFINPDTKESSNLDSPAELASVMKNIGTATTDTTDTTNPSVVFSDNKNKRFYVVDLARATLIKTVKYPEDTYTTKSNVACSMTQRKVACYVGKYTASPENTTHNAPNDAHQEPEEPGRSAVILFDTTKSSQTEEIEVDSHIKEITLGSNNRVFAIDTWDNLVELSSEKPRLIARSVSQMNYVDNLVFIANNQLYRYDKARGQSHLVFTSETTSLSTIASHGSQLLSLFATDGTATSPQLYLFKIGSKDHLPHKGDARLVDILSLYDKVESIDYHNKEIEIILKTLPDKEPIIYYRPDGSGAITYDEATVNRAEADITRQIEKLGIDTSQFTLHYSF